MNDLIEGVLATAAVASIILIWLCYNSHQAEKDWEEHRNNYKRRK